jgi:hypothetical protein
MVLVSNPWIRSGNARRRIYSDKHHMLYGELVIPWKNEILWNVNLAININPEVVLG